MKKKEYVSPYMIAVELKAKHQLLVGSPDSKKQSVKDEYFNQKNIIDDNGDLD